MGFPVGNRCDHHTDPLTRGCPMSRLTWTDPAPLKGEATAHEISEDTPGVAWAKLDGRPRPFHTADAALDEQPSCLLTG
jgi:hypothetical protein